MAFSREPMIGSTSRNRRRTTGYTNPYAAAVAARSAQRSAPQRYANPFAGQPANQPPQDPLVSAIAGGSTGGGFDDTVTPTGINTNAPGAFQEQTQGKTASGGAVPFNQSPPPPPPAPFNPYAGGTSTPQLAPQPSVNNVLPQGSMTPDQYGQASRMNSGITGVQPSMTAADYYALTGSGNRPASQPFNDTVTPTGISTEVATSTPRDLPTMAEAQASQVRQPSMTAEEYRNILRGEIAGIGSGTMTADEYGRLSRGMEDRAQHHGRSHRTLFFAVLLPHFSIAHASFDQFVIMPVFYIEHCIESVEKGNARRMSGVDVFELTRNTPRAPEFHLHVFGLLNRGRWHVVVKAAKCPFAEGLIVDRVQDKVMPCDIDDL